MDHSKKVNIQVETCHYFNIDYDIKERFITYWHQINQIILVNPREILEIGIGNGFVSKYLKERNFNIVTLDIDYRLFPAVVGNGRQYAHYEVCSIRQIRLNLVCCHPLAM